MLIKNDIPILEYDDTQTEVIRPDHEKLHMILPEKAVFVFLREYVDKYAETYGAEKVSEFVSATKTYPIYITEYKGEKICLCQAPVGSSPATQILDWLIGYGVKKVISAGTCGTLIDLPENAFIIPTKALRDEGTSYHYLPPSRFVNLNEKVIASIESTLKGKGLPYTKCATWSTDGFFRETKDKVAYRREEGCSVVEMECSALAACAEFRGIEFGQLLFTADSLANVHDYDEREWGKASFEKALLLCMDIIFDM